VGGESMSSLSTAVKTQFLACIENLLIFGAIYQAINVATQLLLGAQGHSWFALLLSASLFPSGGRARSFVQKERPKSQEKSGAKHRTESRASANVEHSARESAFYLARSGSEQTRILITKIYGECRNQKQYLGVLIELVLFCMARGTFETVRNLDEGSRDRFLSLFAETLYDNLSKGLGKRGSEDQEKFVMLTLLRLNVYYATYRVGNSEVAENLFDKNIKVHFHGLSRVLILPALTCAVSKVGEGLEKHCRRAA